MPEEIKEEKELLERKEIRTMRKDIARLREIEAQKERERIAGLKTAEEIRKRGERLEKPGREEKTKKRNMERLGLEKELKELLEEKGGLEIKRNELLKNNTQLEEILRIILAKELEIEKKGQKIESGRWHREEELKKNKVQFEEELKKNKAQLKETDLKYQQILKREEEIKSSLKRMEESKETGPEKLRDGVEIKEKEIKKVFTEPLIPKPLPKKPSPSKKVLVRGIIVVALLLIFGSLIWSLVLKKPAEEGAILPTEEEIIPPEGKEEIVEKPEISIPPSLISVTGTKASEISQNEEIPEVIGQLMAEELPPGTFTRIVIKNTSENRLSSLKDLSQAFQIEVPEEIFQKLEPDYTLALYSQEQGKRVAVVTKIKEKNGLTELLKAWESKLEKGISISGEELLPLVPYFKETSFKEVNFRYLTISREDLGICYLILDDYFILATSFESIKKAIEEVESLSLIRKIGQLFIIGFEGKNLTSQLEDLFKKYQPGGVLLLSENIESKEQLKSLISQLQSLSLKETDLPLFVAVDQEGEPLSRIEFLQEKTSQSEIENSEQAYQVGLKRGEELKELGINLKLAPLLDITKEGDFLFNRSFQKSPSETGNLAKSLVVGQKETGILTTIKHFPGYGGISFSPEEKLVSIEKTPEISQFKKVMEANPKMVMVSNAIYQEIDPSLPFVFSPRAIQFLKNNLGSEILIISDDLSQNSLLKNFSLKEIVTKPLEAGIDILIFSGWQSPVTEALETFSQAVKNGEISEEKINQAVAKIIEIKKELL